MILLTYCNCGLLENIMKHNNIKYKFICLQCFGKVFCSCLEYHKKRKFNYNKDIIYDDIFA